MLRKISMWAYPRASLTEKNHDMKMDNQYFERVEKCKCLGKTLTDN
jgi:hypothetical protein